MPTSLNKKILSHNSKKSSTRCSHGQDTAPLSPCAKCPVSSHLVKGSITDIENFRNEGIVWWRKFKFSDNFTWVPVLSEKETLLALRVEIPDVQEDPWWPSLMEVCSRPDLTLEWDAYIEELLAPRQWLLRS